MAVWSTLIYHFNWSFATITTLSSAHNHKWRIRIIVGVSLIGLCRVDHRYFAKLLRHRTNEEYSAKLITMVGLGAQFSNEFVVTECIIRQNWLIATESVEPHSSSAATNHVDLLRFWTRRIAGSGNASEPFLRFVGDYGSSQFPSLTFRRIWSSWLWMREQLYKTVSPVDARSTPAMMSPVVSPKQLQNQHLSLSMTFLIFFFRSFFGLITLNCIESYHISSVFTTHGSILIYDECMPQWCVWVCVVSGKWRWNFQTKKKVNKMCGAIGFADNCCQAFCCCCCSDILSHIFDFFLLFLLLLEIKSEETKKIKLKIAIAGQIAWSHLTFAIFLLLLLFHLPFQFIPMHPMHPYVTNVRVREHARVPNAQCTTHVARNNI